MQKNSSSYLVRSLKITNFLQPNLVRGLFADKIVRNTAYSLLEMLLPFILMLVATPFLLLRMGTENYGLWNVALAFIGLLGIFDLGMGTAVTKFIAEYLEKRDVQNISSTATTAIVLNALVGLVFTVILYWFSPWLSQLFSSTEVPTIKIEIVFRLAALGLFPMLFENICLAIPKGFQDYKTPTLILTFQNATTLLLAMIITLVNGSIIHVVTGTVIIIWFFTILSLMLAYQRLRQLEAKIVFSSNALHELLGYMLFMGLTGIGIKIFTLFDRVVVAQVLGFSAAAYYIIATGIANKFPAFASAATQALLPAFSSWSVNHEKRLIWKKLFKATLIMGVVVLVPGTIFLLISRPLLIAWLGTQAGETVLYPMRILVFIYMVKTVTAPSFQAANGLGFPWITTIAVTVASLGTISLIVLLGKSQGLVGASWANIASWSLFIIIFYLRKFLTKDS